jgi:hypothetical protein
MEFNHIRKKLLEIYFSERAIANLDLTHENRIRKIFRSEKSKEKYIHKKGLTVLLGEIGIKND